MVSAASKAASTKKGTDKGTDEVVSKVVSNTGREKFFFDDVHDLVKFLLSKAPKTMGQDHMGHMGANRACLDAPAPPPYLWVAIVQTIRFQTHIQDAKV